MYITRWVEIIIVWLVMAHVESFDTTQTPTIF